MAIRLQIHEFPRILIINLAVAILDLLLNKSLAQPNELLYLQRSEIISPFYPLSTRGHQYLRTDTEPIIYKRILLAIAIAVSAQPESGFNDFNTN